MKKVRNGDYWHARVLQVVISLLYSLGAWVIWTDPGIKILMKYPYVFAVFATCTTLAVISIIVMEEMDIRTRTKQIKEFNRKEAEEAEQVGYFVKHMESIREPTSSN